MLPQFLGFFEEIFKLWTYLGDLLRGLTITIVANYTYYNWYDPPSMGGGPIVVQIPRPMEVEVQILLWQWLLYLGGSLRYGFGAR